MKEIKAIIQPFMLAKVLAALRRVDGLPGITVSQVQGFGKSRPIVVNEDLTAHEAKAKLEIVIPDRLVSEVLGIIRTHACTGRPGDGKIYVLPVEQILKIRTGETDEAAI